MKIIKLLFISFVILSCSRDDEPEFERNNLFNPPSWIHGDWSGVVSENRTFTYNFTNDNIKQENYYLDVDGVVHVNYFDDLKSVYSNKVDFIVEEITNERYSYILPEDSLYSPYRDSYYLFKKVSSNEMILEFPNSSESVLYITFFKE